MSFIECLILSFLLACLLYCVVMLIKVEVMYKRAMKVLYAVYKYNGFIIALTNDPERCEDLCIPFNVIRPYEWQYIENLFDWGSCKKLVPPDVYEKIKPYL